MRLFEFTNLLESLSKIVYHYTSLSAAHSIVTTGQFQLSSTTGNKVEASHAPEGYPYFLSTARSKTGGYHHTIGKSAVMFVLDGEYYNSRYKATPIDYWQDRNPHNWMHSNGTNRSHETEDRIFAKTSTIPVSGVSAVHVYVNSTNGYDEYDAFIPRLARQTLLAAKSKGIAAYLYEDEAAWRKLDTSKAVPIANSTALKSPSNDKPTGGRVRDRFSFLTPWLEVAFAKNKASLSKKAAELVYQIKYQKYYRADVAKRLSQDLANGGKPKSIDRDATVKLITLMKTLKANTVAEFVDHMAEKWIALDKPTQK